jgi:hypothetical protein
VEEDYSSALPTGVALSWFDPRRDGDRARARHTNGRRRVDMFHVRASAIAMFAAWLLIAAPCAAAPADNGGTTYALITPPSSLQVGCQAPCECPIKAFPTYGSFELVRTGADPLYTYYAVVRYIASFNNGPGAVSITGSGQYKIGGEFALMQQLTLDLDIEGHPTEHFDSGLQPVKVSFPQVDISCAVHGNYCYDSVLVVNARPSDTAGAPAPPAGLQAVRPNPFARWTSIAFNLGHPEVVDLMVIDLEGRRVRVLATGQLVGSGQQSVTWEGRRDDGRVAAAGVYWVLLRWSGGVERRRRVKLD